MQICEFSELTNLLDSYAQNFPESSLFYTGSAARGELRTQGGAISSDIDLVLLVPSREHAKRYHEPLRDMVNRVTREFHIEVACTMTLWEHFCEHAHAGYVRSAASQHPIWDELGANEVLACAHSEQVLLDAATLAQPVSYYSTKALQLGNRADLHKARLAMICLAAHLGVVADVNHYAEPEKNASAAKRLLEQVGSLWSSSQFFVDSLFTVSDADLLQGIKERLFLENHGLECELAFVEGSHE